MRARVEISSVVSCPEHAKPWKKTTTTKPLVVVASGDKFSRAMPGGTTCNCLKNGAACKEENYIFIDLTWTFEAVMLYFPFFIFAVWVGNFYMFNRLRERRPLPASKAWIVLVLAFCDVMVGVIFFGILTILEWKTQTPGKTTARSQNNDQQITTQQDTNGNYFTWFPF